MSTTVCNPLKLEDQCLLNLICHLEDYLHETLALLPLHLRHRLLRNLPVGDVCQLENTAVTSGIDMEGSIWKVLCDTYFTLLDHPRGKCLKNRFMKSVFPCTRRRWPWTLDSFHDMRAKRMLFSARGCLGVTNWKGIQHGFAKFCLDHTRYPLLVPCRYVRYFSPECQEVDLVSFLVNECQWMPTKLQINSWQFENSQLWKEHDKYRNITRRLLSQVKNVSLYGPDKGIYTFILTEILNNEQTTLRRLGFQTQIGDNDTMAAMARLFSPSGSRCVPLPGHPNIPYNKLSSIVVSVCGKFVPESVDPLLQSIICFQKGLSIVGLYTYTLTYKPSASLVSLLGSLFYQPQFRELHMGGMTMCQDHIDALLPQFLSAPAPTEEHQQHLDLLDVIFQNVKRPPKYNKVNPTHERMSLPSPDSSSPVNSSCGVSRLPCKALTLRYDDRSFAREPQGQWLSDCNLTFLLSSLTADANILRHATFTLCCPNYHPTVLPHLQPHHPSYCTTMLPLLQHLYLNSLTLQLKPSPDQLFSYLFQGPHLKTVHLCGCNIGPDGLLPALTQGLREQMSVGSLEDLNLAYNVLGKSRKSDLQEFFDVLFSLPQLSNLQVDLEINHFESVHLSLMYKSWKDKAGHKGRQLKVLKVIEAFDDVPEEFKAALVHVGQMSVEVETCALVIVHGGCGYLSPEESDSSEDF